MGISVSGSDDGIPTSESWGPAPDPSASGCEFCGREDRIATRYVFDAHRILRCRRCTFMWLDPRPSEDDLHAVYDEHYFRNPGFFDGDESALYGYSDYEEERADRCRAFDKLVGRIVDLIQGDDRLEGASLLDCGCGPGYLLERAHRRGFAVEGIERNSAAAAAVASRYGFPVHVGALLDYGEGQFDVVTMMDVIEHLHDPFAALRKVAELTKPGGLFVVSTMDSDSLVSRIAGKRLEDFRRVREHLYFFTRHTMTGALERAGFEVLAVKSYGITLTLETLSRRLGNASPLLGRFLGTSARALGLSQSRVHFDPRTKMAVFARRAGRRQLAS